MSLKRCHIIVAGVVQGVFYRAHTEDMARKLGLTGWVRNLPDGSVEVIAEGEESALEEFTKWCRRGPPSAIVSEVKTNFSKPTGEFNSFKIKF